MTHGWVIFGTTDMTTLFIASLAYGERSERSTCNLGHRSKSPSLGHLTPLEPTLLALPTTPSSEICQQRTTCSYSRRLGPPEEQRFSTGYYYKIIFGAMTGCKEEGGKMVTSAPCVCGIWKHRAIYSGPARRQVSYGESLLLGLDTLLSRQ